MRLVNLKTGDTLISFTAGKQPEIKNAVLAGTLRSFGIAIPLYLRPQYGNRLHVLMEDPDFERAFKEVYYTHCMDRDLFQWIEEWIEE